MNILKSMNYLSIFVLKWFETWKPKEICKISKY